MVHRMSPQLMTVSGTWMTSYFKALQNSLVTSDMSKWFGFCVKCDTTRPHCRRQFLHGRDTVSVRAATLFEILQ